MGLLIDEFRHFLAELSARDMIMMGYYRFTFYLFKTFCREQVR